MSDKPEAIAGDEGFLSRWSRRKAGARETQPTAETDPAASIQDVGSEDTSENSLPEGQEPGEPPEFDVSTLPDLDSLGPGSDFSPFMQAGVPSALKTKALRKLWRVKPELANLDGLIDYGEDLTGSFKVVDHLKTAYEVGRGFLKDQADQASEVGEDEMSTDANATLSPQSKDRASIEGDDGVEANTSSCDGATSKT